MGLGGSKRSDNSGRDRIAVQKKCKVTPRAACQNILKIPKFLPDYFFVTKTMRFVFVVRGYAAFVLIKRPLLSDIKGMSKVSRGERLMTYFSSLFVDEDGDVAHEFYYETFDENNSSRLVKKVDNLRPLVSFLRMYFFLFHLALPSSA